MIEPNIKIIGNWIRHYRTELKMTQDELAEVVGHSQGHIANIESGNDHMSFDLFFNIAVALHVTPNDLVEGALGDYQADNPGNVDLSPAASEYLQAVNQFTRQFIAHEENAYK